MKIELVPQDPAIYGGPWAAARGRISDKAAEAELESMINAGMIDKDQAAAVMAKQKAGESKTPTDALSQDPKFLNKVFPKKK